MRKLLVAVALAWAFWTGQSQYVTTVTGKTGVNCQYQYAGQHFWRTFVGGVCPSQVWVE